MGAHHYKLELLPPIAAGADPESDNLWVMQPADTLLVALRALLPKDTSWGGVEEFESEHDWGSDFEFGTRGSATARSSLSSLGFRRLQMIKAC